MSLETVAVPSNGTAVSLAGPVDATWDVTVYGAGVSGGVALGGSAADVVLAQSAADGPFIGQSMPAADIPLTIRLSVGESLYAAVFSTGAVRYISVIAGPVR